MGGLGSPGWPEWSGLGSRDPRISPPIECASILVCLRALRIVKRAGGISEI